MAHFVFQEIPICNIQDPVTSIVPINRITIRNSKLLGNFVTIGIGRF